MTQSFGWCLDEMHDACPTQRADLWCGCSCHKERRIGLNARGKSLAHETMGATTNEPPAAYLAIRDRGLLPTGLESTNG